MVNCQKILNHVCVEISKTKAINTQKKLKQKATQVGRCTLRRVFVRKRRKMSGGNLKLERGEQKGEKTRTCMKLEGSTKGRKLFNISRVEERGCAKRRKESEKRRQGASWSNRFLEKGSGR